MVGLAFLYDDGIHNNGGHCLNAMRFRFIKMGLIGAFFLHHTAPAVFRNPLHKLFVIQTPTRQKSLDTQMEKVNFRLLLKKILRPSSNCMGDTDKVRAFVNKEVKKNPK